MSEQQETPTEVTLTIVQVPLELDLDYGMIYSQHSHSETEEHVILSLAGGMVPEDVPDVLRALLGLFDRPDVAVQLAAADAMNGAGHGE